MRIIDISYTTDPESLVPCPVPTLRANPFVLVVSLDASVDEVLLQVREHESASRDDLLIVSVDSGDRIRGVLHPKSFIEEFLEPMSGRPVALVRSSPERSGLMSYLDRLPTEKINQVRPDIFWCDGGPDGGHPVTEPPPCPRHA